MKSWTIAAVSLAALGAAALPFAASAETLLESAQAGDHDAAMEALQAGGADVNAAAPDGSTALLWAVYSVDHHLVRALLDAGADPDATNDFGAAPLTEAVKLGDERLVGLLLDAGADPDSPNQDNQTALMLASYIGSMPIAQALVDAGADVNAVETFRGQTALMWASGENHPEIAEMLVEAGADVSVRAVHDDWQRQMTSEPRAQFRPTGGLTALLYAARSGCYRCAVAIVEAGADVDQPNPDGVTPLINALDNHSFDIAMYLIDQGANIHVWDMNGRTPIYMAVDMNTFTPRGFGGQNFQGFGRDAATEQSQQTYGAMDVIHRLLDEGVDVNHQLTRMRPNGPGRGRFADYDMRGGVGPLMRAVFSDDHEAMELLLDHGAEVDLRNVFQMTPLMYAAGMSGTGRRGFGGGPGGADPQARAIRTIDLLLDAGADINAQVYDSYTYTAKLDTYVAGRDQEGKTALMSAAENGWDRVVAHMIERGADPAIQDEHGQTALDYAKTPAPAGPGGGGPDGPDPARQATVALLESHLAGASDG